MPDRQFSHNLLVVMKFSGVIRLMACFLVVSRFAFPGVIRLRLPACLYGRTSRTSVRRQAGKLNS